jgi:RNA polymerase sigma factor (sigma-70 family)
MLEAQLVTLVKSSLERRGGTEVAEERQACEEFARACAPIIRSKMRRVHDPKSELDDLVQDVWVQLLRELPRLKFDPARAPICAWVSAIAERHARKRIRRRRISRAKPLNDSHADTLADHEPGPDAEFEWMQEHELFASLVQEFAASLPERDGRIAAMHWLVGCSLPLIASDLCMSRDAAWGVVRRIYPKLLNYLRPRFVQPSYVKIQ